MNRVRDYRALEREFITGTMSLRELCRREAEVRDSAIEAIDEAITRFRTDLRATKRVVLADGSIADEPLMLITPRVIEHYRLVAISSAAVHQLA